MKDILDQPNSNEKVFKENAFYAATFLGGPLAAGYLFTENFKILDQTDKIKPTWIISLAATLFLFILSMKLPSDNPHILIPLINGWIALWAFKKYQGEQIKEYIDSNGLTHNWWTVLGVALLAAVITFVIFYIILVLLMS